MSDKSQFEEGLEQATPEQFAKIVETVEAVKGRRDGENFREKVVNMNDTEFAMFTARGFK